VKLVRFQLGDGQASAGVVVDDVVRDLGPVLAELGGDRDDLRPVLTKSKAEIAGLAQGAPAAGRVDDVRLLAPVKRPGKILALAGNFYQEGAPRTIDTAAVPPWVFMKPATCVSGPEDEIRMPAFAPDVIDEIELAVIIGRGGLNIPYERALEHVAGYTVGNDVSGRSLAMPKERRAKDRDFWFDWLNGKWFDGFASLGPWIVLREDIPDPQNLDMEVRVNGKTKFAVNTNLMIHSVERTIEFISKITTLETGDVIMMGVYHGPGEEEYLQSGDVVEGEIKGIGVLRNRFVR